MSSAFKALVVFSCFFLVIILITRPFSSKIEKEELESGFRLIIVDISKSRRNYDNIKLSDGKNFTYVVDRLRRTEKYQIRVGDSLIKEKNRCDFYYKRKDSVVFYAKDACGVIFKSPE